MAVEKFSKNDDLIALLLSAHFKVVVVSLGRNIAALRAERRLDVSSSALARTYQRLSSGQRINSASDDAAGLAIASSLTKDARVYTQAIRNGNDAISALSIAEGTLGEMSNVITRVRELAVQSANGTFSRSQRVALDKEANALLFEFNRLVGSTTFNGLKLLDGQLGQVNIQLGYGTRGSIGVAIGQGLSHAKPGALGSTYNFGYASAGVSQPVDGAAADFNGDGFADFTTQGQIFIGDGAGGFTHTGSLQLVSSVPERVALGDINGDGRVDIITGGNNGIEVSFGRGDGTFQDAVTTVASVDSASSFEVTDFNDDGQIDIVTLAAGSNSIEVYLGSRNGTFRLNQTVTSSGTLENIAVGDFDGDGKKDIAGFTGATRQIVIFNGNGNGTFAGGQVRASLTGVSTGALKSGGDLNHDGIDDLVLSGGGASQVYIAQSGGALTLGQNIGTFDYISTIVDFDGDGELDILSAESGGTRHSIRYGRGDGTFGTSTDAVMSFTGGAGTYAWRPIIADFNGDGANDFGMLGDSDFAFKLSSRATSTNVSSVNITTRSGALSALGILDTVAARVSNELGSIGAAQSRILAALNAVSSIRDNSIAAAGGIMNADIAFESAERVRLEILQNSTVAVLEQASQSPQLALLLLR